MDLIIKPLGAEVAANSTGNTFSNSTALRLVNAGANLCLITVVAVSNGVAGGVNVTSTFTMRGNTDCVIKKTPVDLVSCNTNSVILATPVGFF